MARIPECQEKLMDFCSVNKVEFYETDQPCLSKGCCANELDIQVKVTKQASIKDFRKAAVIVIAIEKMKKVPNISLFTDDDLMDIINTILEPVDLDTYQCTFRANSVYRFARAVSYEIRDIMHKSLVVNEPAQLMAVHLQGENINQAVRLKMAMYRPKTEQGAIPNPIALGIKGKKLCLSCVQKGEQPVLQLEEANILADMDRSQLGRFIFNRVDSGNITRFESAAHPGWYICTSSRPHEPVGMTNRLGEVFITDYSLT